MRDIDGLEYPYEEPNNIHGTFPDFYNRDFYSLASSLSRFGHRILRNEVPTPDHIQRNTISTINRFCDNSMIPDDYSIMMNHFPPTPMNSRVVLDAKRLFHEEPQIPTSLVDIGRCEQIIFVYQESATLLSIYLVFPAQGAIEGYFVGDEDFHDIHDVVSKILRFFSQQLPNSHFTIRQRLQIPSTFAKDPIAFTYILVLCLHHRTKYLEHNDATMTIQKLMTLTDFIQAHDDWFGELQVHQMTKASHPFFKRINPKTDKVGELNALGWTVVDVLGDDGNSGYYTLILGLENNGNFQYSLRPPTTQFVPMTRNQGWQTNIMRLRHDLQRRSRTLVRRLFSNASNLPPWSRVAGICTEEDIETLSDEFYTDKLTQFQYFNGGLRPPIRNGPDDIPDGDDISVYQMSPFWAMYVFACIFRMRLIVYMRTQVQAAIEWSTTTIDPASPLATRMTVVQELQKISDLELKRTPTIEIFYTTGFGTNGRAVDNHFRLLRRVLCDDIIKPNEISGTSLRECIETIIEKEKDSHIVNAHPDQCLIANEMNKEPHRIQTAPEDPFLTDSSEPTKASQSSSKRQKKKHYENFFNEQERNNNDGLKHKTATLMMYKSTTKEYFIRNKDSGGKFGTRLLCSNIEDYDNVLVNAVQELPNQWIGPSVGDIGDGDAPSYLCSNIPTIHQQHSKA